MRVYEGARGQRLFPGWLLGLDKRACQASASEAVPRTAVDGVLRRPWTHMHSVVCPCERVTLSLLLAETEREELVVVVVVVARVRVCASSSPSPGGWVQVGGLASCVCVRVVRSGKVPLGGRYLPARPGLLPCCTPLPPPLPCFFSCSLAPSRIIIRRGWPLLKCESPRMVAAAPVESPLPGALPGPRIGQARVPIVDAVGCCSFDCPWSPSPTAGTDEALHGPRVVPVPAGSPIPHRTNERPLGWRRGVF